MIKKMIRYWENYPRVLFFLIKDKRGYLVEYCIKSKNWSLMCPCCMPQEVRQELMDAVLLALKKDEIEGEVYWHSSAPEYGDRIRGNSPLRQKYFRGKPLEELPRSIKLAVNAELKKILAAEK